MQAANLASRWMVADSTEGIRRKGAAGRQPRRN